MVEATVGNGERHLVHLGDQVRRGLEALAKIVLAGVKCCGA